VERANPRESRADAGQAGTGALVAAAHASGGEDTGQSIAPSGNGRRLVADVRYFGLEARVLRAGLERVLARGANARLGVDALCEDFRMEPADGAELVSALAAGGLLRVDARGSVTPTPRLREYAEATVVAPLSRARAKILVDRTRELAAQINATWVRNPYRIKLVAVSGSYMSRRGHLTELYLSVVLRKRPEVKRRRWRSAPHRSEAMREILQALRAQSSFVIVRIVADRGSIQRPFMLVYHADDETSGEAHTWDRVRDWGASISRRLGAK